MTLLFSAGCGSGIDGSLPPSSPSPVLGGVVTGNWRFSLSSTRAGVPTAASGSIYESATAGPDGTFTAAVLLLNGGCYAGSSQIPLSGLTTTSALTLHSFNVEGQYLAIQGDIYNAGNTVKGSYQIQGGCATGANGDISGVRLAPLTGTFTGSDDTLHTIAVSLTQTTQSAGDGTFLLSGTIATQGSTCFASGATSVPPLGGTEGSVTGSSVNITFRMDDPAGTHLFMTGSFNDAATVLTISRYSITGGACDGEDGSNLVLNAR